ncbi:uncharacterized protein [Triticum aestivum]|uniref:uncharacterized protein isoform X1 n=1 Tax=Triticum aestivum TaxID=4565 RepID=UPI001D0211DD|nr:uncharacterized protein LOC123104745 isoform X1 [Triticum aestivum]
MERLVFTGTAAAQIGAEVAADRGDEGGRAAAVERGRRHGGPWSWDRVLASAPNRSTLLLPRPPVGVTIQTAKRFKGTIDLLGHSEKDSEATRLQRRFTVKTHIR